MGALSNGSEDRKFRSLLEVLFKKQPSSSPYLESFFHFQYPLIWNSLFLARVNVFCWLPFSNKVMTLDSLKKRKFILPSICFRILIHGVVGCHLFCTAQLD